MTVLTDYEITLTPADPDRDADMVRRWLADPHAVYWEMGDLDVAAVCAYLTDIVTDPYQDAWTGIVDSRPLFFAETYDPAHVLLTGIHEALPGDIGMHILIAPPDGHRHHGLTDAVFASVMRWCFRELGAARVVVEPDVRNVRIAEKNRRAGFRVLREVEIVSAGHRKRAALSVCTRQDFSASELGGRS